MFTESILSYFIFVRSISQAVIGILKLSISNECPLADDVLKK